MSAARGRSQGRRAGVGTRPSGWRALEEDGVRSMEKQHSRDSTSAARPRHRRSHRCHRHRRSHLHMGDKFLLMVLRWRFGAAQPLPRRTTRKNGRKTANNFPIP